MEDEAFCTLAESRHEERGVYAYNENGDVWAEKPKFCPACGAKVVAR